MLTVHACVQVGLFTYALVLGIVAEDVQSLAEGFKKGNSEIVEEGHTVIFHTNANTPNMLRQVLHLRQSQFCHLVMRIDALAVPQGANF